MHAYCKHVLDGEWLALNSPAVIIGAMLISPLMGPIMATGLHVPSTNVSICARQRSQL
jgi:uncharacterized membrane protein